MTTTMTGAPMIGVGLPPVTDGASVAAAVGAAQEIERAGLDHVSFPDLVFGDGSPAVDPLTLAATVAGATSRVRLEFGVLAAPLRPIALLASQLNTLQHASSGRVTVGLGIGGFADAPLWKAARVATGHRGAQLDDALDALPALLRGDPASLEGQEVVLAPAAPAPPVLVGGSDKQVVLDRVVRHADGWFPSLMAPDRLRAGVDRLREPAQDSGRARPRVHFGTHAALGADADEQARTLRAAIGAYGLSDEDIAAVPLQGPADRLAEALAAYAAAGADSITLSLDGQEWPAQLATLAEARNLLRG